MRGCREGEEGRAQRPAPAARTDRPAEEEHREGLGEDVGEVARAERPERRGKQLQETDAESGSGRPPGQERPQEHRRGKNARGRRHDAHPELGIDAGAGERRHQQVERHPVGKPVGRIVRGEADRKVLTRRGQLDLVRVKHPIARDQTGMGGGHPLDPQGENENSERRAGGGGRFTRGAA